MKVLRNPEQMTESEYRRLDSMRAKVRSYEELIRFRAGWLARKDRALLEIVYGQGLSVRLLSELTGQDESTLQRKLRRLTACLRSPEFLYCMRHQKRFSELEMSVARDYFLRRKSIPFAAGHHRVTVYRVRKILHRIRTLMKRDGERSESGCHPGRRLETLESVFIPNRKGGHHEAF